MAEPLVTELPVTCNPLPVVAPTVMLILASVVVAAPLLVKTIPLAAVVVTKLNVPAPEALDRLLVVDKTRLPLILTVSFKLMSPSETSIFRCASPALAVLLATMLMPRPATVTSVIIKVSNMWTWLKR